ncbi:zf-TFIIB domain-containing protein [Cryobacterium sp. Y11]|uniref:TFIIB-type zinc ribbon-containing protein n=1 Tax=Cryobacterium sp. Y11 TaxID=2045016 RepID=UPI000CE4993F|nr:zf-TFIIB domain-containing protein [Cryobacterium sp. Y11]
MKCPTDSATLVMSERSGVEIDYCPECRGVWLDRGELDKILTRAEKEFAAAAPAAAPVIVAVPQQQLDSRTRAPQYGERNDRGYGDRDRDRDRDRDDRDGHRSKKKESWISDLFG